MRVGCIVLMALVGCVEPEGAAAPGAAGAGSPERVGEETDEAGGAQRAARRKSHPDCGDKITRDTRLRRDIGPCDGDGLIIDGDDVELDCDGHRILGTVDVGVGVRAEGVEDVRVEDCRIENFDEGIRFVNVEGGEIEDNELSLEFDPATGLARCVRVDASEDIEIEGNFAEGCRGFDISQSEGLEVEDNEVEDGELGFLIGGSVVDGHFEDNRVRDSSAGFEIFDSSNLVFEENEVTDNGSGFLLEDSVDTVFEDNVASDNDGFGFFVLDASDNVFEDNEANDNGDWGFVLQNSNDNVFEDNEADDNGEFGFFLSLGADDNVFEDNEACDNGDADLFIDADADGNDFDDNDFCEVEEE